jgi:two-component system, NtrC family, sensor histidine kinase HydH
MQEAGVASRLGKRPGFKGLLGNDIMSIRLPAILGRSGVTIWLCVLAALVIVAVLGSGIAVYDVRRDVQIRRDSELSRLQSHAERSASHIASQLIEAKNPTDLTAVRDARWLREYWLQSLRRQPHRRYAAIVDLEGRVIAHTSREQENKRVHRSQWWNISLNRTERVETNDPVLANGLRTIDMRVPIRQGDKVIGLYHAGLDADWLDDQLTAARQGRMNFWFWLISGTCGLIMVSSVAVVGVTRHTAHLEHEIEAANSRRVTEMHELVVGIAHEIRNPLNAIRLNLHTVGQVFRDEAALSDAEIGTMLDEMEGEIARLETLMREMLGFVRTSDQPPAPLDVAEEIGKTMMLLRTNFEQRGVDARLEIVDDPGPVAIDSTRLRQVMFNLLNNAIEALPDGGHIEIVVRGGRSQVEIAVMDNGSGIPLRDRDRIFVPFFSTKASGTGLGLALARKFVEEVGGMIRCEESPSGRGSCFRILLPADREAVMEPAV